jgi:hypothetical protein
MSDLPTIYEALKAVKTAVGPVSKSETNQAQRFNFRGIDAVVNACAPALNEHGIIVTPKVTEYVYETVTVGKAQTQMGHVTVMATYTFHGPGGDTVESTVIAEAMDSGDKACAKAMSVAYRIALLQTLNLPTDEPDPDSTSYERSGESSPKAQTVVRRESAKNRDWGKDVYAAVTIAELRNVWKDAGAAGALQTQVVDRNGEFKSLQDVLYARSDEISFRESAESS